MEPATTQRLTSRAVAVLRAVQAGRAELVHSVEPDLFIDGVPFCDQFTAHDLAHQGLLHAARTVHVGQRVRALLTPAGADLVRDHDAAA